MQNATREQINQLRNDGLENYLNGELPEHTHNEDCDCKILDFLTAKYEKYSIK